MADCDRMAAAARSAGRVLQIGHCFRFWPEYVVTRQLIQGGLFGRTTAASFRRYTAMPAWSPDSWFADEKRSGGQPLDLHIHDTDCLHHVFGLPAMVSSLADGPQVGVLGVWNPVGQFLGCIVNFACHGTTGPGGISADYIFYLE